MDISTSNRGGRRGGRVRRKSFARRLEILEGRTLLNASIDIDADGLMTYKTDDQAAETLNISVSGGVYTFASTVEIDVARNVPNLTIGGDGTTTVTVAGLSGLAFDLNHQSDQLQVLSADVAASIHYKSTQSRVTLGDRDNPEGLGAVSGPITVIASAVQEYNNGVTLDDMGSAAGASYVVTATGLTADNGFGGLTYSGVLTVNLFESTGANQTTVDGTAEGVSYRLDGRLASSNAFVVQDTSPTHNALQLVGGPGANTFDVQRTWASVSIQTGSGTNAVNLTHDGSAGGINGEVLLNNAFKGVVDLTVTNAGGSANEAWSLTRRPSPAMWAQLGGFSRLGYILFLPEEIQSLTLRDTSLTAGGLTVDFSNGNPLAQASGEGRLSYEGGSPIWGTTLRLRGGSFDNETHSARGPGVGEIVLEAGSSSSTISYAGQGLKSVYSSVEATNHTFNNLAGVGDRVAVETGMLFSASAGQIVQTLGITAPDSFSNAYIAQKRNVTINANPSASDGSVTVDFGQRGVDPIPGLETLTIITNGGADDVKISRVQAGVALDVRQGDGADTAHVSVAGLSQTPSVSLDGGSGNNALVIDAGGRPITPTQFRPGSSGGTALPIPPQPGQAASPGLITYSNYRQVTVTNLPDSRTPPSIQGRSLHAVQGQAFDNVVVASFTTVQAGVSASDFVATIDWRDGSSSAGAIVQDASDPSVFYVMGSHLYHENFPEAFIRVTVAGLRESSFTENIQGVPVTFVTPHGGVSEATARMVVDNAPIELTVNPYAAVVNAPRGGAEFVVATFTDLGGVNPNDLLAPNRPEDRYVATIDWGRGEGPKPVPNSAIQRVGASSAYNISVPKPYYPDAGTYQITVTVNDGGRLHAQDVFTATATGLAVISASALSAADPQPSINDAQAGAPITDQIIGSFIDANPAAQLHKFWAEINWGDGSPIAPGRVIQPGKVGQPFFVLGSHVYNSARPATTDGTYPVQIIVRNTDGAVLNLSNAVRVTKREMAMAVTGQLNPAFDSGVSNSDAITNIRRPNFFGYASEPGAMVVLYATPWGGSPTWIGQAGSDATTGVWGITSSVDLPDGGYLIQAVAHDMSGQNVSERTTITSNLIIDTAAPRILEARLDPRRGLALLTFEDFGGPGDAGTGLVQSALVNPGNYRFSMARPPFARPRPGPRLEPTAAAVEPGTNAGPQRVTIQINNGRRLRPGRYLATVENLAVSDIAGNSLEGPVEWRLAPGGRVPIRPTPPPRPPIGPPGFRFTTMRGPSRG